MGYIGPSLRKEQDLESPQEDLRTRFYEHYRKEAEESDREFIKKYEEDPDTTLIFVCYAHNSSVLTRVDAYHRLVCSRR